MKLEGSASNGKITAYQVERRGRSPPITAEHHSDAQFIVRWLSKNLHLTDSCHPLGSEQSKQIVFAPSVEPKFVNVPQNNFVEPFVLNPGTWTVLIEAEGILLVSLKPTLELLSCFIRRGDEVISFSASWFLLAGLSRFSFFSFNLQDYLVLLPSAYYEAPILQMRVSEPCSYSSGADSSNRYTNTHTYMYP